MKTLITLLCPLVILSSIHAQEPGATEMKPDALPEKSSPTDTGSSTYTDPVPLIPVPPPTIEKSPDASSRELFPPVPETTEDTMKKAKTTAAADALKARIHFREIETRAMNNEKVQEQFNLAQSMKTDPEKRAAMMRYYTLLFARMLQIDGSLKPMIALRRDESINRLKQPNINPADRAQK